MTEPTANNPPDEPTEALKRNPGRPPTPTAKRLRTLSISLTRAQRRALIEQAYEAKVSLSALVRDLLFPPKRKAPTKTTKPAKAKAGEPNSRD